MTPSLATRIPKASGFLRPAAPTKIVKPQPNGIALKTKIESTTPEEARCALESNAHQRKTLIRRLGVANKVQIKALPRLFNKGPLKPSQLSISNEVTSPNNVQCTVNETIDISKGAAAMNVTKPVIDSQPIDTTMDRVLTRSNTFVCDAVDDTQVKILSITHNVNAPASNDTMIQTNYQLNKEHLLKERTFKRSLSPIPGETMNSAKRKLMQVSGGEKVISGPMLNSTPRRSISYSDTRKANATFFGAKSVDFSEPQVDQMQTFTFESTTFEHSNSFAPDAAKLGGAIASSTMQGNRVFNLTQTVEQNDAFYPENRNITSTLDANAAEPEQRKNGDATKASNASAVAAAAAGMGYGINDGDANLTKTINGKFNCELVCICASLFYRVCLLFFSSSFLLCNKCIE